MGGVASGGMEPLGLVGGSPDDACLATALVCFLDVRCASYTVCLV